MDIWKLLAGLGVFLFGMYLLEESIKALAGRSFKIFIKKNTNNRVKAILSGALATSILQSSSAVGLMVLAFVGAGIMMMDNAIGVILGSNIGTTFTAWIVATVGFKLDIESLSLPLIGIGGIILIFLGKSKKYSHISKLLVGFGFLFMGLDYMKSSVEVLTESFNIADLPQYGILIYALFGAVITAIMQSSSASIAIVLTSLNAGIIGFEAAAAVIIGANVGTTATILIGGIGATQLKKRVAISHLIFNLVTAIIGLALLTPLSILVTFLVGPDNSIIGIALFHTIFNVMGVLLFFPFIGMLSKSLLKLFPDRNILLTEHLHKITPQAEEVAITSIKKELINLTQKVMKYNLSVLKVDANLVFTDEPINKSSLSIEEKYEQLKVLQAEIFTFSAKVISDNLNEQEKLEISRLLHAARLALHAGKSMKDIKHNFEEFESDDNEFIYKSNQNFRQRLVKLYIQLVKLFDEPDHEDIAGEMARYLKQINQEDQQLVKNVQEAVSNKVINETLVSEMLIVNRTFIQSHRQLLASLRETMLTSEETNMFDSLTESDLLFR